MPLQQAGVVHLLGLRRGTSETPSRYETLSRVKAAVKARVADLESTEGHGGHGRWGLLRQRTSTAERHRCRSGAPLPSPGARLDASHAANGGASEDPVSDGTRERAAETLGRCVHVAPLAPRNTGPSHPPRESWKRLPLVESAVSTPLCVLCRAWSAHINRKNFPAPHKNQLLHTTHIRGTDESIAARGCSCPRAALRLMRPRP